MRDAVVILASSSTALPPNPTATTTTSPHHSQSPTGPKPNPKHFRRSKQYSLNSSTSLLSNFRWDSSSENRHRLKYYADLASKLAEDGRFQDFLMIAESVVFSGVKPYWFASLLNAKLVSAGICRMLNEGRLESLIEVLNGVKKLGLGVIELFDELAIVALRQQFRTRLCSGAEEIVCLMETLQGFGFAVKELVEPSEIIRLCVNKREPRAALRYAQIFPQVHMVCCSIMIVFGKKGDLMSALTVFEASKQNEGCPNMYAYRTMIDVCGLCGDVLKSRVIYEELLAREFTPNIYVFNSLMNVNASDLSYTLQIYKQMRKVGVTADLASYNILLKSCSLASRVDVAKAIYKEVRRLESTGALKLDVFTYSTMIKVLADASMWQMALDIKDHMLLAGVIPNTVTWTSLLSACANAGLVEQAIKLFEEMLQAGCEPNSHCCNILLHACVEACQYDRAFRLFKSWKANNNKDFVDHKHESCRKSCSSSSLQHLPFPVSFQFKPTTSTYNTLMKACGTDYFRAKALMDEMKLQGLSPNHISWSILIDICGGSGKIDGALQILRSMHQSGVQPDVVTYTTAIKVTYNTLLRARDQYGSLQEVQQCLALYQDMRKAGYKPNDYYLKQLIEEWCEGVIQTSNQNKAQFTSYDRSSLGPHSLLLEKVAEHLQDCTAENLSIDLRGLTKIEARIVVLAVLCMIKEKYTPGYSINDDLSIILEDEESGNNVARQKSGVTDAIIKLLRYDLGLEVLSAGTRVGKDPEGGFDNPFASTPNLQEVLQTSGLTSKLESTSRRPTVLWRLRIAKASLYRWLRRTRGASTTSA